MTRDYGKKRKQKKIGMIITGIFFFVAAVFMIRFMASLSAKYNRTYAYLPDYSVYFYDVTDDYAWAFHEIDTLALNGIISGNGEHLFYPDSPITRADFMVMLDRAYGMSDMIANGTVPSQGDFSDVPATAYYYAAVTAAKAFHIAGGTEEELFLPENNITRQDAMVFLKRTLDCTGVTLQEKSLSMYSDESSLDDYAREAASALTGSDIFGDSEVWLNPQALITRAQTAVMLYRAMHLTEKDGVSFYQARQDIANICIGAQIYSDVIIENYDPKIQYNHLVRYSNLHQKNGTTYITLEEKQQIDRRASYGKEQLVLDDPNGGRDATITYPIAANCVAIDVTAPYHQINGPVSTGGTYRHCLPCVEDGKVTVIYYSRE